MCTRKKSAMPPSRSTASRLSIAIGSSLRFPLVMTNAAEFACCKEQMMHRGVRQENPEVALVWRYASSDCRRLQFWAAARWAAAGWSEALRASASISQNRAAASRFAHHHGKRLLNAPLALAQPFHRGRIHGICREVKSPESLDGEYLAQSEVLHRRFDGIGFPIAWPWASQNSSCGPHFQQAFGCAWKRRSWGSSYSARHCSHIGNPDIEVRGRS